MKTKSGISLIAVLMFMLAATTASIVVFKWIGAENFSSAARLKNNEAYQASQAGLENVRGWLTNKGADAGALIRAFEVKNGKPILLNFSDFDMQSSKQQKFKVYLTSVSTEVQPYKFKFLSVGEARDGSKYSQAAIFDVEGLYKMKASGLPDVPPVNVEKVPPFHGTIGAGTQAYFESANVIGDLIAESGFSSTGDVIITGSSTVRGSTGRQAGCPDKPDGTPYNPLNDARPPTYANMVAKGEVGNIYVKENWISQNQGFCGSVYVGGNFVSNDGDIAVWGDLYVGGNLNAGGKRLTVYGNLTVGGCITNYNGDPIDIGGNLVIKGTNCAAWNPVRIKNPDCEKAVCGTLWEGRSNPGSSPESSLLANTLDYLGNQITTEKVDGQYIIPDPIVLGYADTWKGAELPSADACATLRSYATNNVINLPIQNNVSASTFINAVNDCYNNSTGNWGDAGDRSKWLVLRVRYNGAFNLSGQTLGMPNKGNFIIIVENKPTDKIEPPLTTKETNVLMYLTQGANTIEMLTPPADKYRNYFIYSEGDIERIDGSQYITGNLFMARGKKVNNAADFKIMSNDPLFEALKKAGVIKDNDERCKGTGNDRGDGKCKNDPYATSSSSSERSIDTVAGPFDPQRSYVPAVPHLKVKMQSVYASEENPTDPENAMPAILVMPRVIYLRPDQLPVSPNHFKVLYLNGAKEVTDNNTIKSNINCSISSADAAKTCNLNLTGVAAANCNNILCNNAFYVVVVNN